jgi:hypothetical protein
MYLWLQENTKGTTIKISPNFVVRCNRLEWDPSGRILATATTIALPNPSRPTVVRGSPDDGYNLYTFQGTKICEVNIPTPDDSIIY